MASAIKEPMPTCQNRYSIITTGALTKLKASEAGVGRGRLDRHAHNKRGDRCFGGGGGHLANRRRTRPGWVVGWQACCGSTTSVFPPISRFPSLRAILSTTPMVLCTRGGAVGGNSARLSHWLLKLAGMATGVTMIVTFPVLDRRVEENRCGMGSVRLRLIQLWLTAGRFRDWRVEACLLSCTLPKASLRFMKVAETLLVNRKSRTANHSLHPSLPEMILLTAVHCSLTSASITGSCASITNSSMFVVCSGPCKWK